MARARPQSSNTAIIGFALPVEPGTGHQPKDRRKVAQARDGIGHEYRPDGTAAEADETMVVAFWRVRLRLKAWAQLWLATRGALSCR